MLRNVLPALLVASALLGGCGSTVVNPVTGQSERTVMDERTELAEGKKAHEGVLKEYGRLEAPALQAYVNGVGQKLAAQSHRANIPWTFTVLDSPEINAFALPGGYVYLTRGIMAHMDNEADMAGVLGHEIGHVTARHGAQRATRQQSAGIGVLAATILGAVIEGTTGLSGSTELFGQVAQGVAGGYVASYSREQELQADALGAEYLARSHYDPRSMVDVIAMLKLQETFMADEARAAGQRVPEGESWLASHPSNDRRLQAITQNAAQYSGTFGDAGRERYLRAIDGMLFGDSPEHGLVRGQQFYHPPLGFALTAPAGWKLVNAADALTAVNPQGDAGLRLLPIPREAGANHDEVLRKVLNPVSGRVTRSQINGFEATHFDGVSRAQNGQQRNVRMTLVTGPKNAYYAMLYIAADAAALQRNASGLQGVERSFRALNAEDQRAARPWQIRLVPFPRGGYAELARQAVVSERRLALINGSYGRADPPVGQLVKTVVVR
jgi:predicted Zn-dependent protease